MSDLPAQQRYLRSMRIAPIDRQVVRLYENEPVHASISGFRDEPRYVLLGEPGIGKSVAFEQEAEFAGTTPIRAYDFVAGARPPGRVAFIDALEEYRIGEAGIDRLESLINALRTAGYPHWRIACRAISLPPADARRLAHALGDYVTLQLELLNPAERRAMLAAAGEQDPAAFMERIASMGADALLGNPATLLLLRQTFKHTAVPLETRHALFAEATRQMSHELNPDMPERLDRPPPGRIEAAAEAACLVLLLSVRSDLWLHGSVPPRADVVTVDDLLPGRVDTQALRFAADTAMFKGDAAGFQPSHRVVAEYLAGRALARAVAPEDPATPALPLPRALALLSGDNDRPAPALTGVYAWFVTTLSGSRLGHRAVELIALDPEAILFHGDAAALPTVQRRALLDQVGRRDPWFLGSVRGSSAIGGLAGDDLVEGMRAILDDPSDTPQRRMMVLEALANGRRVAALLPDLRRMITTPTAGYYVRRIALEAYTHITGGDASLDRALFDDIRAEPFATAAELRAGLAARLVRAGAIDVSDVREIIEGYAGTGDGVMGYLRALGDALTSCPLLTLFDEKIEVADETRGARSFETRAVVHRVLAATIAAEPALTAERLLKWLDNAGIDDHDRVESDVVTAVAHWVDGTADGEFLLLRAIQDAILSGSNRVWRVDFDYSRFTGRTASEEVRTRFVEAAERATGSDIPEAAQLAYYLVLPFHNWPALYWRLFAALSEKAGAERWLEALTVNEVEDWRVKRTASSRGRAVSLAEQDKRDRAQLSAQIDKLRDGTWIKALGAAADVYNGYRRERGAESSGVDRVTAWVGGDSALIAAIRKGWELRLQATVTTPRAEGQDTVRKRWFTSEMMVVAWAEWQLHDGLPLTLSLPLAFRLLRHAYAGQETAEKMRGAALQRIYSDPEGGIALAAYWAGALRLRSQDLPHSQYLNPQQPAVIEALRKTLRSRRSWQESALGDLLRLAAEALPPDEILAAAERALKGPEPLPTRRLWAFVAFLIAPERSRDLLADDLAGPDADHLFERMWDGRLSGLIQSGQDKAVERAEAVIRHLGPRYKPPRNSAELDTIGEVVASAIAALAREPTEEAATAFANLIATTALADWKQTLKHHREIQVKAMLAARFRPPLPRQVALALAAGPPATPADLRAIVRHTLDELATIIRDGDTSPWRAFWNRPTTGRVTPKVENDCRDLITDRLRDRLERYGIPVRRTGTETRSVGDRRADMLVLGDGAAALPIEVKRHWNKELWTAVVDQLHPYTRSAGSHGHGIYLIFWFGVGEKRNIPAIPGGGSLPATARELQQLVTDRLSPEDRGNIEVVVIDVSEPPLTKVQRTRKAASEKRKKQKQRQKQEKPAQRAASAHPR